jgi:carbon-monoxide dehydrogenase medium subunit
VVGVATSIHVDGEVVDEASVVLTGMGATPVRAKTAEAAMVGSRLGPDLFESAARGAADDMDPPSDLHGTSAYRRHVASVLIQRSLERAAAQIGAPS